MADGSLPPLQLATPQVQHYAYVAARMRLDEQAQFAALTGRPYDADLCARAAVQCDGPAWVYLDASGFPVLIGGFEPQRPGVFEGWHMAVEGEWDRYWRSFTKISARLMDDLFASGAHRIQTCALASRPQAHAWYEKALGMTCDGLQPGYFADGQDGLMFSKVVR